MPGRIPRCRSAVRWPLLVCPRRRTGKHEGRTREAAEIFQTSRSTKRGGPNSLCSSFESAGASCFIGFRHEFETRLRNQHWRHDRLGRYNQTSPWTGRLVYCQGCLHRETLVKRETLTRPIFNKIRGSKKLNYLGAGANAPGRHGQTRGRIFGRCPVPEAILSLRDRKTSSVAPSSRAGPRNRFPILRLDKQHAAATGSDGAARHETGSGLCPARWLPLNAIRSVRWGDGAAAALLDPRPGLNLVHLLPKRLGLGIL